MPGCLKGHHYIKKFPIMSLIIRSDFYHNPLYYNFYIKIEVLIGDKIEFN